MIANIKIIKVVLGAPGTEDSPIIKESEIPTKASSYENP